ncbi:MAG: hypothetical protein ABI113_18580 [Mucilaginibacter sp.]
MKRFFGPTACPTCKRLIIYCVSFIGIFFIGIAVILACSGEDDPYDYYVSFFHNNVQGEHNYGAFYLSYNYVFNDVEPASEPDINAKEWAAYFRGSVKEADIKLAMYQLSSHDDSVMVHDKLIAAGRIPDSLKSNSFLAAITSGNHDGALKYYLFAKGIERAANVTYDKWDPVPVDTQRLYTAGQEALQMGRAEKDDFLKLRYFYQAERLLHFSKDYKQAMAVYDERISNYPSTSHIKGWALALKAGEVRRLGDSVQAAYLFSKVFALYPERRIQAYKNYNFCKADAGMVAKHAANDGERAFIYAIDGFSNPELTLTNLAHVYNYDPASEAVGVLLTREINKLEEKFLTTKLNEKLTGNYNFYKEEHADSLNMLCINHLHLLQKFCNKLSADNKYPEPALGTMAAAYLAWMEGAHTDDGLNLLSKTSGQHLSTKLNDQVQLVKLLLTTQKFEKLNEVNEAQLLPSLQWLDEKVLKEAKQAKPLHEYYSGMPDQSKFQASSRDFYKLVLSEAYLKQHDTVKAALCILKSEREVNSTLSTTASTGDSTHYALPDFWMHYLNSANINRLMGLQKNAATPYSKFLASTLANENSNDLFDLLGTAYLREHNYSQAINAFKKINLGKLPKNELAYVGSDGIGNPFIIQLHDYPKVFTRKNSPAYDKPMFAQKMLALQKQAVADPRNASTAYFQMATGLYNASHYGNSYYLISYDWSSYDYGRANRYSYDDDYVKTKTAQQYYLKARALSNNPEFKAKCTFMAAKCAEKQISAPDDIGWSGRSANDYDKAVRNNIYFAELKKAYAKTAYYKLAVSECSYLRDYLASAKSKK